MGDPSLRTLGARAIQNDGNDGNEPRTVSQSHQIVSHKLQTVSVRDKLTKSVKSLRKNCVGSGMPPSVLININ